MLVFVDLDDDGVRQGIVSEIGSVLSAIASDGLVVNGVVEVRCGFQEFFDGHLSGFLAFGGVGGAVGAEIGDFGDDEETA
jgi:hypothetical protein